MRVRMNERQYSYDAASKHPSDDPRLLKVALFFKKSLKAFFVAAATVMIVQFCREQCTIVDPNLSFALCKSS